MNPYDFVRIVGDSPQREQVQRHERFDGLSGRISCTLTARTPLFSPRSQSQGSRTTHQRLAMNRNLSNTPIISGTSLKGVIRTVAEAASNSCFTLPSGDRFTYKSTRYRVPNSFHTCSNGAFLCPACRLFGMLNRGEVFAGNVTLQDAVARPGFQLEWMTLAILGGPKPHHRAFYSTTPQGNNPSIRGRKFYFHRPRGPMCRVQQDGQNKTVEAVLEEAVFDFEVEYSNIKGADLNLLLFALVLWDDTCHKVGMGKPIGLGSAKIEITDLALLDRQARYRRLGDGWSERLTGMALHEFITSHVSTYRSNAADNIQDLHRILRWDENAPDNLSYPDWRWFKDNPTATLEDFNLSGENV